MGAALTKARERGADTVVVDSSGKRRRGGVAIAAARRIAETASGLTVAVSTSTGIKDPDLPGSDSPTLTVLDATIEQLGDWMERTHSRPPL